MRCVLHGEPTSKVVDRADLRSRLYKARMSSHRAALHLAVTMMVYGAQAPISVPYQSVFIDPFFPFAIQHTMMVAFFSITGPEGDSLGTSDDELPGQQGVPSNAIPRHLPYLAPCL